MTASSTGVPSGRLATPKTRRDDTLSGPKTSRSSSDAPSATRCESRWRPGAAALDLRPLRPLVFGQRHKALDADLVRTIHGFDALLVLTGSTASANL
jgi:hypothetical protein